MKTHSSKTIDDLLNSIDPIEQAKVDARMIIAAKIADAMKAQGWRHKDLLKAMNKENPSIITKWLSGTHNLTLDTLVELGRALDIELLNLSEPKEIVVVYHQSVSQRASTVSKADSFHETLSQVNETEPAYSGGHYRISIYSQKSLARA